MRDFIVYAVIMIGCLVYPLIVNKQFLYKYSCRALDPVPLILNSIALFSVGFAVYQNIKLLPVIIFAVILYLISLFLVKKHAEILNCSMGDKAQMVLANALLPVSVFLFVLLLVLYILASFNSTKNRKR